MSYTQFTASERHQLYQLRMTEKHSIRAIAAIMQRAKSSISRELKRNIDETHRVYLPDSAQIQMQRRRLGAKARFGSVSDETITQIKSRLKQ